MWSICTLNTVFLNHKGMFLVTGTLEKTNGHTVRLYVAIGMVYPYCCWRRLPAVKDSPVKTLLLMINQVRLNKVLSVPDCQGSYSRGISRAVALYSVF